jgi:hypothetical protein
VAGRDAMAINRTHLDSFRIDPPPGDRPVGLVA